MKMIHFKLDTNYVVWKRYEGKTDKLYKEIWLPETSITSLVHEHNGNEDTYVINDYYFVSKKEFEKILEQLTEESNSILGE